MLQYMDKEVLDYLVALAVIAGGCVSIAFLASYVVLLANQLAVAIITKLSERKAKRGKKKSATRS